MLLPRLFDDDLFDDFFEMDRRPMFGKHERNWMKTDIKETDNVADLIEEVNMPFQSPQLPTFPLPEGFKNNFFIKRDEFLDFNGDIEVKMLTIGEAMQAYKDTAFQRPNGMINRELARDCYMIKSISGKINLSPIEIRLKLEKEMSSADFIILKDRINELSDYGLRAGGRCTCPNCHNTDATFIALVDDRFFRPTLVNLRTWKEDLGRRKAENTTGSKAEDVRKHN